MAVFQNRSDAGRVLARMLARYRGPGVVVLGLPRGGIPVAYEVALALNAPLDALPVRKLGAPRNSELAFGAIAPGVTIVNRGTTRWLGISEEEIARVIAGERIELHRREMMYWGGRGFPRVAGKTVILVDDGLATGATAEAAIASLREHRPLLIVFAAPVGSSAIVASVRSKADEVICAEEPEVLHAVGQAYQDFTQTSDQEVLDCLNGARAGQSAAREEEPV